MMKNFQIEIRRGSGRYKGRLIHDRTVKCGVALSNLCRPWQLVAELFGVVHMGCNTSEIAFDKCGTRGVWSGKVRDMAFVFKDLDLNPRARNAKLTRSRAA